MSLFKRAPTLTPELVASAFIETTNSLIGAINIHGQAINVQEARIVELEKAVKVLLATDAG